MFTFLRKRALTSLLPLVVVLLGVFVLARLTGDPHELHAHLAAPGHDLGRGDAEAGDVDRHLVVEHHLKLGREEVLH